MITKIYYYCDSNEVKTVATNIEFEISKVDLSADPIFTSISKSLSEENESLNSSILYTKGGLATTELLTKDAAFDQDFVCFKKFVSANKYIKDEEIAENAKIIWKLIGKFDYQLHKLSYERQLSLIHSLLEKLKEPDIQGKINSLVGVKGRLLTLSDSLNDFENSFRKLRTELSAQEEVLAPSAQKNIVRNLINNELLPYLNNASRAIPETYEGLKNVIEEHIDRVNTIARGRKTRHVNDENSDQE